VFCILCSLLLAAHVLVVFVVVMLVVVEVVVTVDAPLFWGLDELPKLWVYRRMSLTMTS
jgi:hypothetical protein